MTPHVPLDRVLTAVRSVHRQKETAVSAPEPSEVVVETVARAMFERPLAESASASWHEVSEGIRLSFRADARAAIAAMPAHPAEVAVKRVEALADELGRVPHIVDPLVTRVGVARRIRAAIAATQTGEHTTDGEQQA